MYPGYLEFLKASQSQTANTDTTQIPWVPNIYLDFLKAPKSQAVDTDTVQIPWVPNIYQLP